MPPRSAWDGWVLSLAAAMRVSEAALKPWSEFLGIPPEEQPAPEEPTWVTPNTVRIELPAMRLREFANGEGTPTLVVAPFALHGATLADLAPGHSLVERLLGAGVGPLFLVECKSATEMRFFTIDTYLADLALAVEETGGRANLVGLCQGGWLSLMFAARFPQKIAQLALAGSPIDLDAARSPMVTGTRMTAPEIFRGLVDSAEGRMLGRSMQTFWGVPELTATATSEVLQEEAPSPDLIERFLAWHNWTVDLPGAYYLDVVERLFRNNESLPGLLLRARTTSRPVADRPPALPPRRAGGRGHAAAPALRGAPLRRDAAPRDPGSADAGRPSLALHGRGNAREGMDRYSAMA
jgi:pimeloyl-ACP methyl ester carboxylesterase